ncbi:thiamine biosynthesis protein ThiJ [Cystobacter fuscus]|uniref:Thiamine biosynthesis protein ThiJ n=1 Tax=Cystobacter fuscus TaxID=43 RepID=A0A250IV40_9BACT|nr:DJ-1/PfpI family protein [Cystobacter fuscus]ATB34796.1 thiamine biosynthesis protein ThiJ [Cystobacter fuscus]
MAANLDIVFLLYPGVSYLDFMGPQAVFGLLPGARQIFASVGAQPIREGALTLQPLTRLEDVARCDVLCVPGGPIGRAVEDPVFMEGVRRLASTARFVTSVCTGSLILGAAGLLEGRRAACHWAAREQLKLFGAIPDAGRVVRDGHILTGGGVTAGIDFGLTLAAELAGPVVAQAIQLLLEYAPAPPFNAGRPETAPGEALARMSTLTPGGDIVFDPAEEEAIVRRAGEALRASRA